MLRQRMMHFLQNLLFYLTVEVLEPNYHRLESALKQNVSTVDQVSRVSVNALAPLKAYLSGS